jgi:hypothetical protein
LQRKISYRKLLILATLLVFVGFACQLPGLAPGTQPPDGPSTEEPPESTEPPIEPTEPPIEPTEPPIEPEPTTPPEIEPTSPTAGGTDNEGGDQSSSETLIQVLFWLLILVIVILGIGLIVSLFTGRRKEPTSQPAPTEPDQPPSYAETTPTTIEPEPAPPISPRTVLDELSPQVAPLYDRFVNMLQALGPVTILPTQTRVDFQRRIIFASTWFTAAEMRVQMILPRRVDDPRIVKFEIFEPDKIAHTVVIRSVDDFDALFSTWLQEAFTLGG